MNKQSHFSSFFKGLILLILFWLVFTPWSASLDLAVSNFFFHQGSFSSHPLWIGLYRYGIWPAWILAGIAFTGWIFSFFKKYRSWRRPCLLLLLTLCIGAGLIIHAILKDHWGRPRPVQIVEFGGHHPFYPFYEPHFNHTPDSCKSFACGHASMGFYFFSLALLGLHYQRFWVYRMGIVIALGLGILLSLARIAQGGHFLSDTLASASIMWLTSWAFYYFLQQDKSYTEGDAKFGI